MPTTTDTFIRKGDSVCKMYMTWNGPAFGDPVSLDSEIAMRKAKSNQQQISDNNEINNNN